MINNSTEALNFCINFFAFKLIWCTSKDRFSTCNDLIISS